MPKDPCPKTRNKSNWSEDAFSKPSRVTSLTSISETMPGPLACNSFMYDESNQMSNVRMYLVVISVLSGGLIVGASTAFMLEKESGLESCYNARCIFAIIKS